MRTIIGLLLAMLSFTPACFSQARPTIIFPINAGQLKQLCKSYELVQLEVELKKTVSSPEIRDASACLNFIMGVLSTIGAMDVGYFPQLKYEIANSNKPLPYRDFVSSFMKHITAHPENEKESAAAVVTLSLMEGKILIPQHLVAKPH